MNRFRTILLLIYILGIIWSCIHPLSGENWLLEMIPVPLGLIIVYIFVRRYKISDVSCVLMFLYLLMPVVQAHYGVGYVPWGFRLSHYFDTTRNVFDRITHFAFGFLWFYPLFEMARRGMRNRNFLDYMVPAAVLIALGSIYEVAEWVVFEFSTTRLSFLFIGAQDDFYDTPKDMAMTIIGVALAIIITKIAMLIKKYQRLTASG